MATRTLLLNVALVLIAPASPAFAGRFYRISIIHFAGALILSAVLLVRRFVVSKNTVARQQLKWVVWGSVLAIAPFTLLYALGFALGADTAGALTDVAVLPLILIPLSLGYSANGPRPPPGRCCGPCAFGSTL